MPKKIFRGKYIKDNINKDSKEKELKTSTKKVSTRTEITQAFCRILTEEHAGYIVRSQKSHYRERKNNSTMVRKDGQAYNGKNPFDEDGDYMFNPKEER
ncbi:hypothetical protein psyc5s11_44740 [Clostridium gelidum]|uniref:DUF3892 domain-containing protein n=1 Tax=Clostridium gelidum TaxID=704125 RepID=A0ABN6J690_9CLOT|nr:hypothetical protein [Clostridium gelidum]BCZ48407.1 hypothetical protein psyc5s11_44740 [Clostridium gelidum]